MPRIELGAGIHLPGGTTEPTSHQAQACGASTGPRYPGACSSAQTSSSYLAATLRAASGSSRCPPWLPAKTTTGWAPSTGIPGLSETWELHDPQPWDIRWGVYQVGSGSEQGRYRSMIFCGRLNRVAYLLLVLAGHTFPNTNHAGETLCVGWSLASRTFTQSSSAVPLDYGQYYAAKSFFDPSLGLRNIANCRFGTSSYNYREEELQDFLFGLRAEEA